MKTKEIPIEYIKTDEKIMSIRNAQSEEAIGRYMEKYESGTSKPILLKEIDRQNYILIDGHHRIEAIKRLKKRKIEAEIIDISDKEIYSKAVEQNVEHGVSLTKQEEENVIINLFDLGKTQKQMGEIFHISQQAISKRISNNPILKKQISSKICISSVNEILSGKSQKEVACILQDMLGKGTQQRVSQIWGDFTNELEELYNTGTPKEEIVEIQNEKNINLTQEKLDELIEGNLNEIREGDCLKIMKDIEDSSIDCVIIDPPYGIDYQSNYKKEKYDKIKSDNKDSINLLDKSLDLVKTKMKKDSHIYIFTSWKVFDKVKPIVEKHFEVKNCLIWNKQERGMGDLDGNYADSYEMIIFARQGKRKLYSEKRPFNIINCSATINENHPTEKPVELLGELICNSTKEEEIVLDYFAGSGSTLIASKENKRKWIGIELENENINIIKKRLSEI